MCLIKIPDQHFSTLYIEYNILNYACILFQNFDFRTIVHETVNKWDRASSIQKHVLYFICFICLSQTLAWYKFGFKLVCIWLWIRRDCVKANACHRICCPFKRESYVVVGLFLLLRASFVDILCFGPCL